LVASFRLGVLGDAARRAPTERVEVLADLLFERLGPKKMRDEGISREKAASQAKR